MSRRRRPTAKAVMLIAVALLLVAGVVVTATAAPGPATDVKTAQYGPTVPPATSGPCKGVGGEAGATCQSSYKAYKAKKRACNRKKSASKRRSCLKKLKKDNPSFAKY